MNKSQNTDHTAKRALRTTRCITVFAVLAAAFAAVIIISINTGSVSIPVGRILRILLLKQGDAGEVSIIWKIRMPRILQAAVLGGALALSGFLLQTFFGNPIAGPFVLGISSGAKMCVAVVMILLIGRYGAVSSWTLILAAFAGAMMSTAFILMVSRKVRHMAALLVAGVMIGYICSAVTDFIVTFAEDSDIVNLRGWSLGSFNGMNWTNVAVGGVIVGVAVILTFFLSKPIGAFQLGEHYAQSMGINVKRFRVVLILLSSILSASVTAFAGPISFVGIAVPFLMKQSLSTSKPIIVVPATFLGGGVFCMICDLIARMAFSPQELNISTVTSMFGAPIVIFMLIRRQKARA